MSKRAKSHYSQAHVEAPNAAERVFSTPYLARDIVHWSGMSSTVARSIHPSVLHLENRDPAFKMENDRLMPNIKIFPTMIIVSYPTLRRTEKLATGNVWSFGGGRYDLNRLNVLIDFGNDDYEEHLLTHSHIVKGGEYNYISNKYRDITPRNQPLNPTLWKSLIEAKIAADSQ